MTTIFTLLFTFVGATILAMRHAPIMAWAGLFLTAMLIAFFSGAFGGLTLILLIAAIALALASVEDLRSKYFARPAFKAVSAIVPPVSDTEREALEGGTVGWDAELFSGAPDYEKLRAISPIRLSDDEQAFIDGPTETLCKMVDDWQVRASDREIPDEIWDYVRENGFLGMLISKQHGGLGFSAQAQSLILGKIASRSPDVSVIVMVPNSLGPGELIEKYGTEQQVEHYLPRLAAGKEIPCFALTGPTSGSDAATMRDIGIVKMGMHEGKETLGISLSWEKRYITLGPKATLLGLAFRLFDPENLMGDEEDLGITLALIPTDHKGVTIGNRHIPSGCAFPNGPNSGEDVFIPLEWIIGGKERVGQGWKMLMSCLAAGRAISLPSSSTAAAKAMLRFTTAYGTIRNQFGIPINNMEGIEERLSRMVETAYVLEAARAMTASIVQGGEKPAVISALLKYQSTEWARVAVNDAMDIHAGRAVCDGPSNYLQSAYQSMPVGITVEGANILTRTLITFAQGALRSHPYLYKEVEAINMADEQDGFEAFEPVLYGHIKYSLANIFGAFFHNITMGAFAHAPHRSGNSTKWYRSLSRASRNFALLSDVTVALLGGSLKMKQKISGRMADALSELYFISAILKRYEDDGQITGDLVFVDYSVQNALHRFYEKVEAVLQNYPTAVAGVLLRVLIFPLGNHHSAAKDRLGKAIVKKVLAEPDVRERLTHGVYISQDETDPTGILEVTMKEVVELAPVTKKLEKAIREGKIQRYHGNDWIGEATNEGILNNNEAERLRRLEKLTAKVIAVDQFEPAQIKGVAMRNEPENIPAE
ncbi:MAG: acyl-CoA dehydrogenase [Rhodomicrobium sp.]|nr:MAG: acyl-CoA dehydrogenase [Rhodomicrobium sp.]